MINEAITDMMAGISPHLASGEPDMVLACTSVAYSVLKNVTAEQIEQMTPSQRTTITEALRSQLVRFEGATNEQP